MPPVLGPLSPSKARLWSWAPTSGSTCSPSQSAKKLASSPSMNSSITTEAPAAPKRLPASMSRTASIACSTVSATITPLPAARPSALTTIGAPCAVDVGDRLVDVGEALIGGGRDVVAPAELLGEALGAFELGRRLGRSEDLDAGRRKAVGHARHQRRVGADHDEVDFQPLGERHLARDILGADIDAFGDLGDAGIAGGAVELGAERRGRNRPAQRMFAAAAAYHQDSHGEALTTVCAVGTSG